MDVTLIFKAILGIAESMPMIMKKIDQFYDFYLDTKIKKIEDSRQFKKQQRKALYRAVRNATDDQERIALSVLLNDVEHAHRVQDH